MLKIDRRACIAAMALLVCACGDDSTGAGGGGGNGTTGATSTSATSPATTGSTAGSGGSGPVGSGGSGGAGGGPDLDKDPADVTDPEDCYFEGGGGEHLRGCTTATIELSAPVPLAEVTVSIEASDGTIFENVVVTAYPLDELPAEPTFYANDPANVLYLRNVPDGGDANEHYAPEWLDVEVRRNDVLIAAERYEPLEYACSEASRYHFCWESAPVTLDVTNPELD